MITEKNIYRTIAYKQMKAWCDGDKVRLKRVVKEFVDNRNAYTAKYPTPKDKLKATYDLMSCFMWHFTPQGALYWERIHYAYLQR